MSEETKSIDSTLVEVIKSLLDEIHQDITSLSEARNYLVAIMERKEKRREMLKKHLRSIQSVD